MYLGAARSVARRISTIRPASRAYATRRVIQDPSLNIKTTPSRPTRSIGHLQGPPTPNEAPLLDGGFQPGVFGPNYYKKPQTQPSPSQQIVQQEPSTLKETLNVPMEDISRPIIATETVNSLYHQGERFDRIPYWQKIRRWKDVTEKQFLSYEWNKFKGVKGKNGLSEFLQEVLPEKIPPSVVETYHHIETREAFIEDVREGIKRAPMSISLTPHILSMIDWTNPIDDPLRRQFIPMNSGYVTDHPKTESDSLHEKDDMVEEGLVHRYPDKVLFLATSVCGLYCRFCTRAYKIGPTTEAMPKHRHKSRWDDVFAYIAGNPAVQDVVLSGGDSYYLEPSQLRSIGDRLLDIPHIRRFRVATKGLCVTPSRTLDLNDTWTAELIRLSNRGRKMGKQVAIHTHFNHSQEWSWVTREATQKLYEAGVIVRNQSVLLRGVNDTVEEMGNLIRTIADNNVQPYYVYTCDMVPGVEDLRTPLSTALEIESHLRGSIGGFLMPNFIVDLPHGGGKRLAASFDTYDTETGRSTFRAPAVKGNGDRKGSKEGMVYEYWDPVSYCSKPPEAVVKTEAETEPAPAKLEINEEERQARRMELLKARGQRLGA